MTTPEAGVERLLLLGRAHDAYGEVALGSTANGRVAVALSVGADPDTPAAAYKARADEPNEDAVFALVDHERVLLVVADAHRGAHASHALLQALHDGVARVPASPAALLRCLATLPVEADEAMPDSATSLLAVVHRADLGEGFGVSFGDATCVLVGPNHDAAPLHPRGDAFVHPGHPATLDPRAATVFAYEARPGSLVVAFTDGVDQCCYRRPERSPGPADRRALFDQVGADPAAYARALARLSLEGLPGESGGQDNLAIAVAAT